MLEFLALLATVVAVLIGPISKRLEEFGHGPPDSAQSPRNAVFGFALRKRPAKGDRSRVPPSAATRLLVVFSIFVTVLGIATAATNWDYILSHQADVFYFVWLVTVMVFGMFAQVLDENIREGRSWHQLTATELLLPTLFSIVVFYPIWNSVASRHGYFSFYSAFLNGYFWKTIVASVKPPTRDSRSSA